MSLSAVPRAPANAVGCVPELQGATATFFYLRNKWKRRNFIIADVTHAGYFHFLTENLPKDGCGCAGSWLFETAWDYFVLDQRVVIRGVRGDWTWGDNLDTVNRLTVGGKITLEEASKRTWTYRRANGKGFRRCQLIDAQGGPGQYTSVDVVFLP